MKLTGNRATKILQDIRQVDVSSDGQSGSLAKIASWALWPDPAEDVVPDDLRLANDGVRMDVMLIGANWGSNHSHMRALLHEPDWANFHSDPTKHRGPRPHRKLGRAFAADRDLRTDLGGAYMTDLFKMVPTPNTSKLTTTLKKRSDLVSNSSTVFKQELLVIRSVTKEPPLIIAMGVGTYRLALEYREFNEHFEAVFGVSLASHLRRSAHYSDSVTKYGLALSLRCAYQRHHDGNQPDPPTADPLRRRKEGQGGIR